MSTLRFAAACSPRSSRIKGLEFFFVTGKALFCSAIYFAEACGKSVTVGTMKWRVEPTSGTRIAPRPGSFFLYTGLRSA